MYITFKLLVHVLWKWMDRQMENLSYLSHPTTSRCNLKYNRLILTDNFGMTDLLSRPIFDQCGILLALILCSNTSRSKPKISCPCKVNMPQFFIAEIQNSFFHTNHHVGLIATNLVLGFLTKQDSKPVSSTQTSLLSYRD